jgi:quercetin dioxygenase-like cupin family protein
MTGTFVHVGDVEREQLDWGELGWMSRPPTTGAEHLTVIAVELLPGHGHDFHKHPDQEEVIYVVDGEVEQWIEREKRTLRPGDSAFIGMGVVHASFNVSDAPIHLLAILGPCVGEGGYEMVEVAGEEPWSSLRG